MGTKMRSKKTRLSYVIWMLLLLFTAVSCNNSNNNNQKSDVAAEAQDVKEEINELIEAEKKLIKEEVDSAIAIFNQQAEKLETNLEKTNQKLDNTKQDVLADLKTKSDNLKVRVNELEQQTEENWENFKIELQHDTKEFKDGVAAFFEDNK